jgi:hypothetical protein|tara:strand:- start:318 stop:434 length:117 start_codon:yes stop_codon:yes gene_type:complete
MINKIAYKFFAKMDEITEWIATKLAGKRCQCGKKGNKK